MRHHHRARDQRTHVSSPDPRSSRCASLHGDRRIDEHVQVDVLLAAGLSRAQLVESAQLVALVRQACLAARAIVSSGSAESISSCSADRDDAGTPSTAGTPPAPAPRSGRRHGCPVTPTSASATIDRHRLHDVRQQVPRVRGDRHRAADPRRAQRVRRDREVHRHGHAHRRQRRPDVDLHVVRDQAPHRGDGDEHRAARDQRGLRHRRQALRLAVPVRMRFVGRLQRQPHREERQPGCEDVLGAVDAVAEHRDRAEREPDRHLHDHQQRVRCRTTGSRRGWRCRVRRSVRRPAAMTDIAVNATGRATRAPVTRCLPRRITREGQLAPRLVVAHDRRADERAHARRLYDPRLPRRVSLVDDERVDEPGVDLAPRRRRTRRGPAPPSSRPRAAAAICPPTIGLTRDAWHVAPRATASRIARHRQDRPDAPDRVARRDEDRLGAADRLEHARRGRAPTPRRRTARRARRPARAASPGTPGTAVRPRPSRRSSARGRRSSAAMRTSHAERPRDVGGDRRQRPTLAQQARAVQVRREVAVADPEPRLVHRNAAATPASGTCRRADPSRAPRRPRPRART